MSENTNERVPLEEVLTMMEPVIRAKAKAAADSNASYLNDSDIKDIEQIMRLAIVTAYPKFDPEKGEASHFFNKVISNALMEEYRSRHVRGLDKYRISIVIEKIDGESGVVPEGKLGLVYHDGQEEEELEELISNLPEIAQIACRHILDNVSQREVARRMGMSQMQFRRTVLPVLKKIFREFRKKHVSNRTPSA